jgi:hypothetical protein
MPSATEDLEAWAERSELTGNGWRTLPLVELDSLALLDLAMLVEEHVGRPLAPEWLATQETVRDVLLFLDESS